MFRVEPHDIERVVDQDSVSAVITPGDIWIYGKLPSISISNLISVKSSDILKPVRLGCRSEINDMPMFFIGLVSKLVNRPRTETL